MPPLRVTRLHSKTTMEAVAGLSAGSRSGPGPAPTALPPLDAESRKLLEAWRDRVSYELDTVIDFWIRHSHDPEHGGFFSCLSRDGTVYDETKYVWMQGRQVWVYARLYRSVPRFRRPELLEAARAGERGVGARTSGSPGGVRSQLGRPGSPCRRGRVPAALRAPGPACAQGRVRAAPGRAGVQGAALCLQRVLLRARARRARPRHRERVLRDGSVGVAGGGGAMGPGGAERARAPLPAWGPSAPGTCRAHDAAVRGAAARPRPSRWLRWRPPRFPAGLGGPAPAPAPAAGQDCSAGARVPGWSGAIGEPGQTAEPWARNRGGLDAPSPRTGAGGHGGGGRGHRRFRAGAAGGRLGLVPRRATGLPRRRWALPHAAGVGDEAVVAPRRGPGRASRRLCSSPRPSAAAPLRAGGGVYLPAVPGPRARRVVRVPEPGRQRGPLHQGGTLQRLFPRASSLVHVRRASE